MADHDNIDKKIREGFGDMKGKAPGDLWSRLNDQLDDDAVDAVVRNGFEQQNLSAPEGVWKEVNKQLTIDRAWKGVHRMLNWRTAWRRTRQVAALLLLLLLIFWGGNSLFNNNDIAEHGGGSTVNNRIPDDSADMHQSEVVAQASEAADNTVQNGVETSDKDDVKTSISNGNNEGANEPVPESNSVSGVEKTYLANSDEGSAVPQGGTTISEGPIGVVNNRGQAEDNAPSEFDSNVNAAYVSDTENEKNIEAKTRYINKVQGRELALHNKIDQAEMTPRDGCVLDTIKDNEKKWKLDIGLISVYQNTSLLNNETRKSFDKNSLISSSASFAGAYGGTASLIRNDKHGINITGYFQSRTMQQYGLYIEGQYADKVITLDYGKVAITYQRNLTATNNHFRKLKTALVLKGGMYYGWLKKMSVSYTGTEYVNDDKYANSDIGLTIQAGQDLRLNRFVIGYGLNLEQGLKNIYSGNAEIPAYFNRTVLFNAGVYMNFRYQF